MSTKRMASDIRKLQAEMDALKERLAALEARRPGRPRKAEAVNAPDE